MDTLFFWISKLAWLFIAPDSLFVLLFVFGTLLLWKNKLKWSKRIFTFLCAIVLFIGFFPIGDWILYPLESKYKVNPELKHVDGIIVLSGAINPERTRLWNQTVINDSSERLFAFIALSKKYPEARLVYTGGSGDITNQHDKHADVAARLFREQGLDTTKIAFESESRNTSESSILTKKIVNPQKDEKWVLITTAWHMPRSIGIFCKADWLVIPYPVDFRTKPDKLFRIEWSFSGHLSQLKIGIKEWLGVLVYSVTGKSC